MDWSSILATTASAVLTTFIPIGVGLLVPRTLTLIAANIHSKDVQLIANAATRAAGRIALAVSVAKQSNPAADIAQVISQNLVMERNNVTAMVGETIAKVGTSPAVLESMIKGELGKQIGAPGGLDAIGAAAAAATAETGETQAAMEARLRGVILGPQV